MCYQPPLSQRDRLNRIRSRLMRAVRSDSAVQLRQSIVHLASDIEAMVEGRPVADELEAATQRSLDSRPTVPCPPSWELETEPEDSAPPVPIDWDGAGA
jgi:hypothetical protein